MLSLIPLIIGDYLMKGTRPLSNAEIEKVSKCFEGMYEVRNRALFMIGVSTGGRISELLRLKIGDVWQNDRPVTDLLFQKGIVKGGKISRAVPLNADGRLAVNDIISMVPPPPNPEAPLFQSRKGGAITRKAAADILSQAFTAAGLNGKLATHSLRKSFAQRLYDESGDIFMVKEMLGHQSVQTTQVYLGINYANLKETLENIAIATGDIHRNRTPVYRATDGELLTELLKRGIRIKSH